MLYKYTAMLYWFVRRIYSLGAVVPRHFFAQQEEMLGMFCLAEERDDETRRTARVARLKPHPRLQQKMPPPLYDAAVVHAGGSVWTVSGYERDFTDSVKQVACYQSWYMRPASAGELQEIEEQFRRDYFARLPETLRPDEAGSANGTFIP